LCAKKIREKKNEKKERILSISWVLLLLMLVLVELSCVVIGALDVLEGRYVGLACWSFLFISLFLFFYYYY
jgi:uncharacterized BrkB/YihY/UPF0761 family membrane protein